MKCLGILINKIWKWYLLRKFDLSKCMILLKNNKQAVAILNKIIFIILYVRFKSLIISILSVYHSIVNIVYNINNCEHFLLLAQ